MTTRSRVAVVVTTYKRVELLPPLISEIMRQVRDLVGNADVRVVVVDNDPDESARASAADFGVGYAPESRPGIAAARQRALDEAADDDALIMVDDDVVPESGWLKQILSVWEQFAPTVVMGFVRWVWPDGADEKVKLGGFMQRAENPTGDQLDWLATGNVLIDVQAVRRLGLAFDVSLGLNGGEDTLFGKQILDAGGTIIACRESSVRADIPPERATASFARKRAIGQGMTHSHLQLRGRRGVSLATRRAAILGAGVVRTSVFAVGRIAGRLTRNIAREGTFQRRCWFAIGRVRGAIGHVSDEYARKDRY